MEGAKYRSRMNGVGRARNSSKSVFDSQYLGLLYRRV